MHPGRRPELQINFSWRCRGWLVPLPAWQPITVGSKGGGVKGRAKRRWAINSGERRKEGALERFLLLGRKELLKSRSSWKENLQTLDKIKQTTAWGLRSLSKTRPIWGKLKDEHVSHVECFCSLVALCMGKAEGNSWNPERKLCCLFDHWNQGKQNILGQTGSPRCAGESYKDEK